MTIFTNFNPVGLPDGTTMASLGWTDSPGVLVTGVLQAAPNFRVISNALAYTPAGGSIRTYPRTLYDVGQPFVRGQLQIKNNDNGDIILAANPLDFIIIRRTQFSGGGGLNDQLSFDLYRGGVLVSPNLAANFAGTGSISGTTLTVTAVSAGGICTDSVISGAGIAANTTIVAQLTGTQNGVGTYQVNNSQTVGSIAITAPNIFPYFCRYNPATFLNQYTNLPTIAAISWVITGNQLDFYVDSTRQYVYNNSGASSYVTSMTLPTWMVGAQKAGYYANGGATAFSYPFTMRNNSDLTLISSITPYRYDATKSGLTVAFTSNVAGATSVHVTVADAVGTELLAGDAPLFSGAGTINLGPVPKVNEGTLLTVTVTNVGGTADTNFNYFPMPVTVTFTEAIIGQNESTPTYFSGWWPFNDLAKAFDWRTTPDAKLIFPSWANPADYQAAGGFTSWRPASDIGRQANGSPTKFPDDPAQSIRGNMPWTLDPGEYIMDFTQTPDLLWSFAGTLTDISVDLNYYGTLQHRLTVRASYIPNWSINLTRDGTKANNGMPTTSWLWTITKVGTTPEQPWTVAYRNYWKQSGVRYLRYMSSQFCNEPTYQLPYNLIKGANRVHLTDQNWVNNGCQPFYPVEAIVALHNDIKKDIWINVTRLADDAWITAYATYFRDNLDPTLKVIWARSNERWNSTFPQFIGYRNDGWAKGLGKPGAGAVVNATVTNTSTTLTVNSVTSGVITVGMPVRCNGVPIGAAIASFGTGSGGVGTYNLSSSATANATDTSAVIGGAVYGANNGAYDWSATSGAPPVWTSGTYAVDTLVVDPVDTSIYRCYSAVTGSTAPRNDAAHWVVWQQVALAIRRSHIQQNRAMRDLLVTIYGSEGAFHARNLMVSEVWESQFATDAEDYITWGNNYQVTDALASAPYYANLTFQWAQASPAMKNAVLTMTGQPRINVFRQEAAAAASQVVASHAGIALYLASHLVSLGLASDALPLWNYEGGKNYNWNFNNATIAPSGPIDQTALYNDILEFYRNQQYDIYTNFIQGIVSISGGRITHFEAMFPYNLFWPSPQNNYLCFGVSNDINDTADTSTMYRAIRDVSLLYGGTVPPDDILQRRPQPLLLR